MTPKKNIKILRHEKKLLPDDANDSNFIERSSC